MSVSRRSEKYIHYLPSGARRLKPLKKGRSLPEFQSGGPYLYLLESGLAIVDLVNARGEVNCLGYRRPYSTFGELPDTVGPRPHNKQITALYESTIIEVRRDQLPEIIEESAEMARAFRIAVIRDTRSLEDYAALAIRTTVGGRLPQILIDLAEGEPDKHIDITQELIARIAGSFRSRVNVILSEYRKANIVTRGQLRINGTKGLQALRDAIDNRA